MGSRNLIAFFIAVTIILSLLIPLATFSNERIVHVEVSSTDDIILSQEYDVHSSIVIVDESGFGEWNGSGTQEDPYIISNLLIQTGAQCIYVSNITSHFIIRNCQLQPLGTTDTGGVRFVNVAHGTIENCSIRNARWGVYLERSNGTIVRGVTVTNCVNGIQINNSNSTEIADCILYSNESGLRIGTSMDCIVRDCDIYRNRDQGVHLSDDTSNCTLYSNRIGWNVRSVTPFYEENGVDEGVDNQWYNGTISRGNSWTGYDGIGSYPINGSANSIDRYPTPLVDSIAPAIDSPSDLRFEEGETAGNITWTVYDEFPLTYVVRQDGSPREAGIWQGTSIFISFGQLQLGAINFTIRVVDAYGHESIDTVYVIVIMSIFGGIGSIQVVAAAAISVLSVAFVIIVIKKLR